MHGSWITLPFKPRRSVVWLLMAVAVALVFTLQYSATRDKGVVKLDEGDTDTETDNDGSALDAANRVNGARLFGHNLEPISIHAEKIDPQKIMPYPLEEVIKKMNRKAHANDLEYLKEPETVDAYHSQNERAYVPQRRIVHFDLKGAPPTVPYFKRLLELVKSLGATGILLEWEDMFPWDGDLRSLAAGNAYSRKDVDEILDTARKNQLEIIPLVQTFAHLEFALKGDKFMDLREVPELPQAICPSKNASIDLIKEMIDQIMKVHEDSKFIHIGCDEVFQLGECVRCRSKPRDWLFASHVATVARYVRQKYANATPLIWDDMLRHLPLTVLQEHKIGQLVEPMIWVYAEEIYHFLPHSVWEKYRSLFEHMWTVSAFKGAFGETYFVPNVKRHFENNVNWLHVMAAQDTKLANSFRGIVISGWQRYDHFATLCETLPAATPSLAVTLLATSNGYFNQSVREMLYDALKCELPVSQRNIDFNRILKTDPFLWNHFSHCSFPGSSFYRLLLRLKSTEKETRSFLRETLHARSWLTEYNVRRNFSSPFRINELMSHHGQLYYSLVSLVDDVRTTLKDLFDEYTINEWIEQNIYSWTRQLERVKDSAEKLKLRKIWPRRPLPILEDLKRIG